MAPQRVAEAQLWATRDRDDSARQELVRRHLPLARSLAGRYRSSNEPFDDLVQVAALALVKAVRRFDPERGRPFAAFAAPTILGELKRHFRDTGWSVHVARGALELALRVQNGVSELQAAHGRSPSVPDLAAHLGLSADEVLEGLEAAQAHYADSLDVPVGGADSEDSQSAALVDHMGGLDGAYADVELRSAFSDVVRRLPAPERRALVLRLRRGLKQSEIADIMDISQMSVSRMLRRAGERLRGEMEV